MTLDVFLHPGARAWTGPELTGDPRDFHASLPGYAPTPLREFPSAAAELDLGRVFVKDESSRLGLPAFKILGASWAVHRATEDHRPSALVTATDGNHGRALARTGRLLGIPVRIHTPVGVHPAAIAAIRAEGADVTERAANYDQAVCRAADVAQTTGALLVQDMAWSGYEQIPAWIVEGYTTMAAEIDEALATHGFAPDLIVVPVGVGSLAQAILQHYRAPSAAHRPAVLAVEPTAAACVLASLHAGALTSVATGETIMAGLNCGTPTSSAWPVLAHGLDGAVAVTDVEAAAAAHDLRGAGIDSGPCGAATLAGLRRLLSTNVAREALGLSTDAIVVLLSTEGSAANPALPQGDPA
ncbi:MAG: pyridoxal-phosphate dependent enzyme [Dermatophilaceae bacterium]